MSEPRIGVIGGSGLYEMEGFEEGGNPEIWTAVNDVAAMIKELDPNHPTMTVTAFVHGERIEFLHLKLQQIQPGSDTTDVVVTEPDVELIAAPRSPPGSPPPSGLITVQNSVWLT